MKKIIALVGVVVFAASMSQAALLSWKINNVNVANLDYYVFSGDITSTITSWGNETLAMNAIIAGVGTSEGTVGSRGSTSNLNMTDAPNTITVVCASSVADGVKFYYSVVDTTSYLYEKPATPTTLQVKTFSESTFKPKTDPVPEPCAAALLALGLAAFGMKRKVA